MLNTHHRGCVLFVRTFCEPNTYNTYNTCSIMNAIEDSNGDVSRVDLRYIAFVDSPERVLPKNALLAIKEPFYKTGAVDGKTLVRVDQPSNLVLLKPGDDLVPKSFTSDTNKLLQLSAARLKKKGNMAFSRGDWQEAVDYYSGALAVNDRLTSSKHTVQDDIDPQGSETSPTTQQDFVSDCTDHLSYTIHRNRAQARLKLGLYELAAADALSALIPGNDLSEEASASNSKALFRAGLANYELGNFTLAHSYLKQARHLIAGDKSTLLERTERRLQEQNLGNFDFTAMGKSATAGHTRLDHASFLRNTQIGPAGDRGRGLFATKDMAPGDVILVEKAFYAAFQCDVGGNAGTIPYDNQAKQLNGVMEKLRWNPQQAAKYLDLFDGGTFENKDAKIVDGMVVVDIFQVQAIAALNGFTCPRVKSSQWKEYNGGASTKTRGIWLHAAIANHSCLPNATRAFIGDMMILRANRKVQAGEEILMTYYPDRDSYTKRKKALRFYAFECDCKLCRADQAMPQRIHNERDKARTMVEPFVTVNQPPTLFPFPPAAKIREAKDLLKQLESTYDEKRFEHLPRTSCALLDAWICKSQPTPEMGLDHALRLLRDLGYFVTVKGGNVVIDRSNAIVAETGIHGAMYASQASLATGNDAVASAFKDFAKELYVILHAEIEGFEKEFC